MKKISKALLVWIPLFLLLLITTACSGDRLNQGGEMAADKTESKDLLKDGQNEEEGIQKDLEEEEKSQKTEEKQLTEGMDITLKGALKGFGNKNPLMTQRLGADPYALVYQDRVYIYMTGDVIEYGADKKAKNNSFGKINTINVISSSDLVNWTDHGAIKAAGSLGAAKWGNNSWAPAAAYKEIDGKPKFFLYFANGGNGIGVLTADSPIGPFTDPLGHALVSRSTPNCANVAWLFDPAVLVDDDNKAYLYFGGGIPGENFANPGTGRAVQLGDDMISLAGDPVTLDIPYLFEDSGINKIGDTYYYSYCSNWNVDQEATDTLGFASAEIVYMTSKNPLGPFTLQGSILKNPGIFFGCYGNNHHCMFRFKDQMYITYHTQILEQLLKIKGGYRCTHIDPVTVEEDGKLGKITATKGGVAQVGSLNPYEKIQAETIGTMAGITTVLLEENGERSGTGNMAVTDMEEGSWLAVYGADFSEKGAEKFTAAVRVWEGKQGGVQIRIDRPNGDIVGYLPIEADTSGEFKEISTKLSQKITGKHDLVFAFTGEGYELDYWYFQ